jgi:hypothetical protein
MYKCILQISFCISAYHLSLAVYDSLYESLCRDRLYKAMYSGWKLYIILNIIDFALSSFFGVDFNVKFKYIYIYVKF